MIGAKSNERVVLSARCEIWCGVQSAGTVVKRQKFFRQCENTTIQNYLPFAIRYLLFAAVFQQVHWVKITVMLPLCVMLRLMGTFPSLNLPVCSYQRQ